MINFASLKKGEIDKLNLTLHSGVHIKDIDQVSKTIIDSNNDKHSFDLLVMATGSRAFVPKDAQLHLPGRFTMRNKIDADNLRNYLVNTGLPENEQHVVIVGGGLLGLELAASLKKEKHQYYHCTACTKINGAPTGSNCK